MKYRIFVLFLLITLNAATQERRPVEDTLVEKVDSSLRDNNPRKSVAAVADPGPRRAAIRSAILPGWGQIYNKKYWKLPLVYGALGVTGAIFASNLKTYKESRFAYSARYRASGENGARPPTAADSVDYFTLAPRYKNAAIESIRNNRDTYREYIDYSVLFFILFWGLNVVDASVDAHLKNFDVSPDLSLKFKPGHSQMANTTGLSIVLTIGKHQSNTLPSKAHTTY